MTEIQHNNVIAASIAQLERSLLQYAAGCRVWTPPAQRGVRPALLQLAQRQSAHALQLRALLEQREYSLMNASFPADYPDLNFVSWSYLAPRLLDQQQSVVEACQQALQVCQADAQASVVMAAVCQSEQELLRQLEELPGATRQAPAGTR